MKDYERIRANVSKHFKDEIESLKLEILRLNKENADLQVENAILKNDIRKYKNQFESISENQKTLLGLTAAIKYLI